MKHKPPLRIGFDLDGVILYNPARTTRALFAFLRVHLLKKKKLVFHVPKSTLSQIVWYFFHKSSLGAAPGYRDLLALIGKHKIEAYIVSGRYGSLERDFKKWMTRLETNRYFTRCYFNENDEQPFIFKAEMIKRLKLDYFVEDNWDIVNYLQLKFKEEADAAKVLWVSNILDRTIPYEYKFFNFRSVIAYIKSRL